MKINLGKIAQFVIQHADTGVRLVESMTKVFKKGSGADKKDTVRGVIEAAIEAGVELSGDEQAIALLPEVKQAYDAVIEAKVSVMKAQKELLDVLKVARASYAK